MAFPSTPTNGQTIILSGVTYSYDLANTAWKRVAVAVSGGGTGIKYTAANTTPSSNTVGDQWYNVNENILYEYINDGTSNNWVDISTSPVQGVSSGGASGTTNARSTINSMIFGG